METDKPSAHITETVSAKSPLPIRVEIVRDAREPFRHAVVASTADRRGNYAVRTNMPCRRVMGECDHAYENALADGPIRLTMTRLLHLQPEDFIVERDAEVVRIPFREALP